MRGRHRVPYDSDFRLKTPEIPDGFVLLQDQREQRPLFSGRIPSGLLVKSTTLLDGDYSIMGFEEKFCIERKGISDLFPYCSSERERTMVKMQRFLKFDFVALVIEERECEVLKPQMWTRVSPETVRGALVSFSLRYHIHVHFNPNRDELGRWILDHAIKYWKIMHETKPVKPSPGAKERV
jgi:ERCC4-type nuclease